MTRALVLIHGIGEQRPMETMWRFLKGVFDLKADGSGGWKIGSDKRIAIVARSKPDRLSGNFELRCVNIDPVKKCDEKHFEPWHCYELFWQHVFRDHRFVDILDWVLSIVFSFRPLGSIRLWILRLFLYALIGIVLFFCHVTCRRK